MRLEYDYSACSKAREKNHIAHSFYAWFMNPSFSGNFLESYWDCFMTHLQSSVLSIYTIALQGRNVSTSTVWTAIVWMGGINTAVLQMCHFYIFGFADHTEMKNEKIEFPSLFRSKILGIIFWKRCQLRWHVYARHMYPSSFWGPVGIFSSDVESRWAHSGFA